MKNRPIPAFTADRVVRLLAFGALAAGLFPSPVRSQQAPAGKPDDPGGGAAKAIIVLDASGSMWGQIDGRAKIDIARDVIAELLNTLDPNLELGLMAYGHRRKGDCTDIELLIPPGKVDRKAFLDRVMNIMPVGKTPLTAAVEQAADVLKIAENPASVILVSDGIETCDRDPCELARKLAATGVAFKTHIVAFDLSSKEADTIRCLADETGGQFLPARDAGSLRDALEMAVQASAEPAAPPMPEEKLDPATVKAPASVPAGSVFKVEWEGPGNPGDYLTIVAKGAEDRDYGNYGYTRKGSPLDLTATITPGPHEVRYVAGRSRTVLGRADIEVTPIEATLKAPAEVVAGSHFQVEWTGPANRGDFVTIVPRGAEEGDYGSYAYAANGNPSKIRALNDAGEAEVRYVTGQKARTLARAPIVILPAEATLTGPESAIAGSTVRIAFTGPANQGDYITIVKVGTEEGRYGHYQYPKNSSDGHVEVRAPEEIGPHEIRYVAGAGGKTLATAPIELAAMAATLRAPESVVAGSAFKVEWTGPGNQSDIVTIVPKGAEPKSYGDSFYSKRTESPGELRAPETPGDFEVRYKTAGNQVLAAVPVKITSATATLKAAASAIAGAEIPVEWTGPGNRGDFIAIVSKDAENRRIAFYTYTRDESTVKAEVPETAGEAEIRYVTGQDKKTLAAIPIVIQAATAELLEAPDKIAANDKVSVKWNGPNNRRDVICIVPPDAPARQVNNYIYPVNGPDQQIRAPRDPGEYEYRYVTGRDRNILARKKVTVVAE